MNGFLTVTRESFLLLRRDKVFLPAALGGAFIVFFASIASQWAIEDFDVVAFDIAYAGFNFIGSLVAIYWSTKSVADARSEGTLEIQIAMPVGRGTWLLAKFMGLVLNLALLSILLIAAFQGALALHAYPLLTIKEVVPHAFLFIGWCVLASLGIFFASFCGQATSLFSTLALWILGLTIPYIAATLAPTTDHVTRYLVETAAWGFDLQRFNVTELVTGSAPNLKEILKWNAVYGAAMIAFFLIGANLIFRKKDIII
jgi:ABC-type transport system involved in multi-copper enzyme maturation permease subunit